MIPVMESKSPRQFNAQAFLDSAGIAPKGVAYRRDAIIFSQGDVCDSVMYIQKGGVKLSVRSKTGKRAGGRRRHARAGGILWRRVPRRATAANG